MLHCNVVCIIAKQQDLYTKKNEMRQKVTYFKALKNKSYNKIQQLKSQ